VQAISYFLLFGILQSEDYALLIGSIGIFCVVALLMFLTRRVDWYSTRFASVHTRSEVDDGDINRILANDESFSGGAQ